MTWAKNRTHNFPNAVPMSYVLLKKRWLKSPYRKVNINNKRATTLFLVQATIIITCIVYTATSSRKCLSFTLPPPGNLRDRAMDG